MHHDVGDLQPAARLQHSERLSEYRVLWTRSVRKCDSRATPSRRLSLLGGRRSHTRAAIGLGLPMARMTTRPETSVNAATR
jgi:hypothetical protein